jgi:hypothetical protein
MDLDEDFERGALDSRVDGIVDQFHHRVGRRPVIGKERGSDGRIDPLADGYALSHSSWKSIPDWLSEFSISTFGPVSVRSNPRGALDEPRSHLLYVQLMGSD